MLFSLIQAIQSKTIFELCMHSNIVSSSVCTSVHFVIHALKYHMMRLNEGYYFGKYLSVFMEGKKTVQERNIFRE